MNKEKIIRLTQELMQEISKSGLSSQFIPVISIYDSTEFGLFAEWCDKDNNIVQVPKIDNINNCDHEWKSSTFDSIGFCLTEYCESCGIKRDVNYR